MIFNAENFDIFRLGSVAVSYAPKNINTVALLVSPENIGALSLEFESELKYDREGAPFFGVSVARETEGDPERCASIMVEEGDWIVILWNEIRIFHQEEFEHTFQIDHVTLNEDTRVDFFASAVASEKIRTYIKNSLERQNAEKTQIVSSVGELDQEQMEVRTSSWSGKKVLMRPGVYDQLADDAKKMFGPIEEMRTLAEAQDLELYDRGVPTFLNDEGERKPLPEKLHNTL
jgi:hypothetical protein